MIEELKTVVKNFTERDSLEVSCMTFGEDAHVLICSREGNLSMQHNMTPAQARQMAQALDDYADECDSYMMRATQ